MDNLPLFNVNGSVGRGAYETPDFADVAEFLEHMDYLGIDRSLVWHVESRDLNPQWGNKRLLKEIEEAGAEERLIPAFVISPACYFEYGTLNFLRESLSSGKVKALRIIPSVSRFPIRELERLLLELAEYEPLVLWDCPTFATEQDFLGLEHLAKQMPKVNFAVTQKMWPGFGAVLDLMWRCPNVYVDISWLHMRDTIELLCEHFGAERVLFGIGYKSHYGAAVAMLAHADISAEQRNLIAHGNIERLLSLAPLKGKLAKAPALLESKPLWGKCRAGQPLKDVRIVDAHAHTGPHTRGWLVRDNDFEQYIQALIKQKNKLGVDKVIICPESALFGEGLKGNREAGEALNKHSDHFAGYLIFNPLYKDELIPELDNLFADGFFVGFKLLASYWRVPLTDASYTTVWEYADKHKMPILLHTWDDKYNSPAMLKDIVTKYPNAKFILGHSGGGSRGRKEAEELALANPNVFLEFCGSFTTPLPFEDSAAKVGWEQVIFGSDTGAHSEAWELGRFLSMPVPDDVLADALGTNFDKILEESC
jgi:predicted TIM-barrel fold metal-dependent hydrolase